MLYARTAVQCCRRVQRGISSVVVMFILLSSLPKDFNTSKIDFIKAIVSFISCLGMCFNAQCHSVSSSILISYVEARDFFALPPERPPIPSPLASVHLGGGDPYAEDSVTLGHSGVLQGSQLETGTIRLGGSAPIPNNPPILFPGGRLPVHNKFPSSGPGSPITPGQFPSSLKSPPSPFLSTHPRLHRSQSPHQSFSRRQCMSEHSLPDAIFVSPFDVCFCPPLSLITAFIIEFG